MSARSLGFFLVATSLAACTDDVAERTDKLGVGVRARKDDDGCLHALHGSQNGGAFQGPVSRAMMPQ